MSAASLDVLQRLGSCGVSDVLDGAGMPQQLLAGLRPVTAAKPLVGRARTVQLAPMTPGTDRPDRHLGAAAVDAGGETCVVVVAVSGDWRVSGAWGGLLSLAAHTRGIRGTIVAGLCRDTDEIRELGYPVYAYGATPTTARGRLMEVAVEVDVTIDGITVKPGDYVVADGDGIIVVPAVEIDRIVLDGAVMLRAESDFGERIRRGSSLASVLSVDYESLTEPGGAGRG